MSLQSAKDAVNNYISNYRVDVPAGAGDIMATAVFNNDEAQSRLTDAQVLATTVSQNSYKVTADQQTAILGVITPEKA